MAGRAAAVTPSAVQLPACLPHRAVQAVRGGCAAGGGQQMLVEVMAAAAAAAVVAVAAEAAEAVA